MQQKNDMLLILNPKVIIQKSNQILNKFICDYSDAYILVRGNITATPNHAATQVVLKNCAPFKDCRTKINDTLADYADFINITMPMYNLI